MTASRAEFDSRRSPRRALHRALGILYGGRFELAQSIQISEGGMAILTSQPLAVDSQLVLSFVIPGGVGLIVRGCVGNEREKVGENFCYGIQFVSLDLHQRRMIRGYVSAKTQAEAEAEE